MNTIYTKNTNLTEKQTSQISRYLENSNVKIKLFKPTHINLDDFMGGQTFEMARFMENIPFVMYAGKHTSVPLFTGLYNSLINKYVICDVFNRQSSNYFPGREGQLVDGGTQFCEAGFSNFIDNNSAPYSERPNWNTGHHGLSLKNACIDFFNGMSSLINSLITKDKMDIHHNALLVVEKWLTENNKIMSSGTIWNDKYETQKAQAYYNEEYRGLSSLETDV